MRAETTHSTPVIHWSIYDHRELPFYLAASDQGLCQMTLGNESFAQFAAWIHKHFPDAVLKERGERTLPFLEQIDQYFAGRRQRFTLPLDLRGTPFQVAVWRSLLDIPFGQTRSYAEVAQMIGRTSGFRAVGGAVGANPVAIFIPCHRVIGKNGALTGFGGGVPLKIELLALEGITFPSETREYHFQAGDRRH